MQLPKIDVDKVYMTGPSGCGVTTQATLLQRYGFKVVSLPGPILVIKDQDMAAVRALTAEVLKAGQNDGLVIDGFPNSIAQVIYAVKLAKEEGHRIKIVAIQADESTCKYRLAERRNKDREAGQRISPNNNEETDDDLLTAFFDVWPLLSAKIKEVSPLSLAEVDGLRDILAVHHQIVRQICA
jgi:adenylate kinase family enzyme